MTTTTTNTPPESSKPTRTNKTQQEQQEENNNNNDTNQDMQFGKFVISSKHIFYRSLSCSGFVNLRPIVPGHVLVVPHRVVPLLRDLTQEEYSDLWNSVRDIQNMLTQHYQATGFNVAVQDGYAAGQSVPHVHVHILPRTEGDLTRNDDVYDELEAWAPRADIVKPKSTIDVPEDKDRHDRTPEQMEQEATMYRNLF